MKNNYLLVSLLVITLINSALIIYLLVSPANSISSQPATTSIGNYPSDEIISDKYDSDQITFNNWRFNPPAGWEGHSINDFRLGLAEAPYPQLGGEYVGSINLSTYNNNYASFDEAKKYFYQFHSAVLDEKELTIDGYPAIWFSAEGYQGKPSPDTADTITYIDGPNGVLAVELVQPQYLTEYEQIINSLRWRS